MIIFCKEITCFGFVRLAYINHIKNVSNNAFILFAHHNKYDDGKEPTLGKNIITGGKTLTNYASNVFQIGTSSMGADVRRGKITKMRDYYSELLNEPLRLGWSPKFDGIVGFKEGLELTINWFKKSENRDLYKNKIYNK